SRKGRALAAHPAAALVFWWEVLERQVRITGAVEKLEPALSDAYYNRRPRGSRIGAHASSQSRVIADRQALQEKFATTERLFVDSDVPRPAHWGGFRLLPRSIEFWQARQSRLHDRLHYQREGKTWTLQRLAP